MYVPCEAECARLFKEPCNKAKEGISSMQSDLLSAGDDWYAPHCLHAAPRIDVLLDDATDVGVDSLKSNSEKSNSPILHAAVDNVGSVADAPLVPDEDEALGVGNIAGPSRKRSSRARKDKAAQLAGADLRQPPAQGHKGQGKNMHAKYKTTLCSHYVAAGCKGCTYGDRCAFAHGEQELRAPVELADPELVGMDRRPLAHSKYKTMLCTAYSGEGKCWYADKCTFAHGDRELMPISQACWYGPSCTSATCRYKHSSDPDFEKPQVIARTAGPIATASTPEEGAQALPPSMPRPPPLPIGWQAVWSEEHGAFYFWRVSNGQTQWENPALERVPSTRLPGAEACLPQPQGPSVQQPLLEQQAPVPLDVLRSLEEVQQ